jgi:hypothetical protein
MADKVAGYCGKIFAAVFTSVVAPLLVHLAVQDISDERARPAQERQAASPRANAPRQSDPAGAGSTYLNQRAGAAPQAAEVVHVIACGVGRTPEAALRDALHTALYQAVTTRVGAGSRTWNDRDLSDDIWRNAGDLILRWEELGSRKEWKLRGLVYHKEVAVEVNGRALADRLTTLSPFGPVNRPSIPIAN